MSVGLMRFGPAVKVALTGELVARAEVEADVVAGRGSARRSGLVVLGADFESAVGGRHSQVFVV